MAPIHIRDRILSHVSAFQGQEAAGENVAAIIDEKMAFAGIDAFGRQPHAAARTEVPAHVGRQSPYGGRNGAPIARMGGRLLLTGPCFVGLHQESSIVRGLGHLDDEIHAGGEICQFAKHRLKMFGVQLLQFSASSHGNQEENLPEDHLQRDHQFGDGPKICPIVRAEDSIDLQRQPDPSGRSSRLQGPFEGAWSLSKGVVAFGRWAVQTKRHLMETGFL